MQLSEMVSSQLQLSTLDGLSGIQSTDRITQAFARASSRLTQQIDSTNVQLSAFGQIKSSFAAAQTAANALTTTAANQTATGVDVRKAVQAFVDSFNQAAGTAGAAVNLTGALANQGRAALANSDLTASITAGSGITELRQLGITRNQNGTLTLDTNALDQAFQSNSAQVRGAMTQLGQQVGTRLGGELTATGNVGASVATLTQRSETLATQQTTQDQKIAAALQSIQQQSAKINYSTATGLAAYQALFGG